MREAAIGSVANVEYTKRFSAAQFRQIARASSFIGVVAFWRTLERLTEPEPQTRLDAMKVQRDLARQAFEDCGGIALAPQEAECFPLDLRSPGWVGRAYTDAQ